MAKNRAALSEDEHRHLIRWCVDHANAISPIGTRAVYWFLLRGFSQPGTNIQWKEALQFFDNPESVDCSEDDPLNPGGKLHELLKERRVREDIKKQFKGGNCRHFTKSSRVEPIRAQFKLASKELGFEVDLGTSFHEGELTLSKKAPTIGNQRPQESGGTGASNIPAPPLEGLHTFRRAEKAYKHLFNHLDEIMSPVSPVPKIKAELIQYTCRFGAELVRQLVESEGAEVEVFLQHPVVALLLGSEKQGRMLREAPYSLCELLEPVEKDSGEEFSAYLDRISKKLLIRHYVVPALLAGVRIECGEKGVLLLSWYSYGIANKLNCETNALLFKEHNNAAIVVYKQSKAVGYFNDLNAFFEHYLRAVRDSATEPITLLAPSKSRPATDDIWTDSKRLARIFVPVRHNARPRQQKQAKPKS
jgi:hypothetical protein